MSLPEIDTESEAVAHVIAAKWDQTRKGRGAGDPAGS